MMEGQSYHFIGIGGIGMSGLARIVLSRHIPVSGSDISSNAVIAALSQAGARISIGHHAKHISPGMTVIYSTDIKKDNPEYQAAIDLKCLIMHRSELLQLLMKNSCSLAVAGTHGKTTTSALLAWVLEQSGLSPSYAIGGIVPQLHSNAAHGGGQYFVAEACESDGTLLNYTPYGAIITNIDLDHMDYYDNDTALIKTFQSFMGKVVSKEHLFWCGDDQRLKLLNGEGASYGFSEDCTLKASHFHQKGWKMTFDVDFQGRFYSQVEVALIGKHNALNALAVFGLALSIGIEEKAIRKALQDFKGVKRRSEKIAEKHGILFIDDYGHHPTEIQATLRGIRDAIGERRLVVAYQPHRYSRTKACIGMYQGVFNDADNIFVTEIYAAREAPVAGISHETVMFEVKKDLKNDCQFVERLQLSSVLSSFLRPHDVFLSLGAGDITKVSHELLSQFETTKPKKLRAGVIVGGKSVEHEISLQSGKNILAMLRSEYYDVELFGITRNGNWVQETPSMQILHNGSADFSSSLNFAPDIFLKLLQCEIIFPVLHGLYGEDGTIQGFFEMLRLAYVGCDHRSASICMDKALTKKLLLEAGLPTSPFITFCQHQWDNERLDLLTRITRELQYPVFVKPTHLGSSVGVSKVSSENDIEKAVKEAFRFDTHLLIENGIEGRELEFAVVGNHKLCTFPPGEILTGGQVYDYHGKYDKNGIQTTPQASLSTDFIEHGKSIVLNAYKVVGCSGMARIDAFLDKNGKFWLNEINPIPGFTKNSLFPQMCALHGLNGNDLTDRLIVLGLQRKRQMDRLETIP